MALFGEKYGDHVRALNLATAWNCGGITLRILAKSGILKSFQKEPLLQEFDESKRLQVMLLKFSCFSGKCIE
jgi:hypothetical protein